MVERERPSARAPVPHTQPNDLLQAVRSDADAVEAYRRHLLFTFLPEDEAS